MLFAARFGNHCFRACAAVNEIDAGSHLVRREVDVDIGSVNSSALSSIAAQQRGGVGALGEVSSEVAAPLEAPPGGVGPQQGGVVQPGENQSAGGQGGDRPAAPPPPPPVQEQQPTYESSGRMAMPQSGRDGQVSGGRVDLMA